MRRVLRWVNVLVAAATLASALAVLTQDLLVPGYRAHHRDALWFVAGYCGVQLLMLVEFARDGHRVAWLALAKTLAAYLFLLGFSGLWPRWGSWTPARYVYQLLDWGDGRNIGLYAFVFLGRGIFNTVNVMAFTRHWWEPLRASRPLFGRVVTAIPVGAAALSAWWFLRLVTAEAQLFSPEAQTVAREIHRSIDCAEVTENLGKTSVDSRQRGEERYEVTIAYGCPLLRVHVVTEDGRLGVARGARPECCEG